MSVRHWGPHFPDAAQAGIKHWSLHFPDTSAPPSDFTGYGPPGVATLVLDLEQGLNVTYRWITDVQKMLSGKERRPRRRRQPQQSFRGVAKLLGNNPRKTRAQMARYAAVGAQFLLGLPYEALSIRADSSGTSVPVHSGALALTDWKKPGQRVVVSRSGSFVNAIIQDVTSDTIVLNVSPGTVGKIGGTIMPALAVFLEPQQDFPRYPINVEEWQLSARASIFDFAPTLASLAIVEGVVTSRKFGAAGNAIVVAIYTNEAGPAGGTFSESGNNTSFTYKTGVTTYANLAAAFANSNNVKLTGSYNPAHTLTENFSFGLNLTGGSDTGDVGTGASLTTYLGSPVWDRPLVNDSTVADSVHALTDVLDHGGVPVSIGTAAMADWARNVALEAGTDRMEWQWFKLFLATVVGRQKTWWLPTYRSDFTFVSKAANTVTVSTTDGSDFFAWWPAQRQHLHIEETNGTVTRAQVTAAVDNGNGTITLTIGTTLASSSVRLISWLELCRFEKDEIDVSFDAGGFSL